MLRRTVKRQNKNQSPLSFLLKVLRRCSNTEHALNRCKDYHFLQAAIVTLYVVVMVFGLVANLLIVTVILRHRRLYTVTNVFIVSLAMADIALCGFNLPIQLHYQITDNWVFGSFLCKVNL